MENVNDRRIREVLKRKLQVLPSDVRTLIGPRAKRRHVSRSRFLRKKENLATASPRSSPVERGKGVRIQVEQGAIFSRRLAAGRLGRLPSAQHDTISECIAGPSTAPRRARARTRTHTHAGYRARRYFPEYM